MIESGVMSLLPPGWLLIVGALLVPVLRGPARQAYMLALPGLGLWQLLAIPLGTSLVYSFMGYELELVRVDAMSRAFGTVFYLATLISVIYAMKVKSALESAAALVYAGSAIAAVFAGDLITLFVNWELTAISSVFLVWASGTADKATPASCTEPSSVCTEKRTRFAPRCAQACGI